MLLKFGDKLKGLCKYWRSFTVYYPDIQTHSTYIYVDLENIKLNKMDDT